MSVCFVIGQYRERPAEGMQVLTRAVVDGLRREGRAVHVFEPTRMAAQLWQALRRRPTAVIFTHGPGTQAVMMSALLDRLTRARIVWLAPRPDLATCPPALAALTRLDLVLSSRMTADLAGIVERCGALFVKTVHGVDRNRFRPLPAMPAHERAAALGFAEPPQAPVLLHVGHIRPNRGLELLVETKRRLGDRAELVVFGSPTFPPDVGLLEALRSVGAQVQVGFTPDLALVYGAADLYLFPATDAQGGAIDLPLSVLEALAVGVPVLTTPFGATPEVLAAVPGVSFAEPQDFAGRCDAMLRDGHGPKRTSVSLPQEFDLAQLAGKVVRMVEATP